MLARLRAGHKGSHVRSPRGAVVMQYIHTPANHHMIKFALDQWSELTPHCTGERAAASCLEALLHARAAAFPLRLTRRRLRLPPAAAAERAGSSSGLAAGQPAAKRAKVDAPAASAAAAAAPRPPGGIPILQHPVAMAAMAAARPPLHPGAVLPAGMVPQAAVTAAQASAAAQLRIQQQLAAKAQFQPIVRCVPAPASCAALAASCAAPPAVLCCADVSMRGLHGVACMACFELAGCWRVTVQRRLLNSSPSAVCLSSCRPQSEDERQFVPRPRLQVGRWRLACHGLYCLRRRRRHAGLHAAPPPPMLGPAALAAPAVPQALVRQVGLGMSIANAKATEEAEAAMRAVAEDFISNAGEAAGCWVICCNWDWPGGAGLVVGPAAAAAQGA